VTQAGIHADGLLKDEEIYNIFDTGKLLKSPPSVAISSKSGLAGIAVWLTRYLGSEPGVIEKNDPRVVALKKWVDAQYDSGRVTTISPDELAQVYQTLEQEDRHES
jgi:isopropylmalate/homocitrate/citramalate synthase